MILHSGILHRLSLNISTSSISMAEQDTSEVITLADVMGEIGDLRRDLRNLNNDVLSNGSQLADLGVLISEVLKRYTEKTQGE